MKKLLLTCSFLFTILSVSASHILGGEIYYDKLPGLNQYEFTLLIYRDPTGVGLGSTQVINNSVNSQQFTLTQVPGTGINYSVQVTCNETIEVYEYKGVTTITTVPVSGMVFSWSSCCRPPGVDNIVNSSGQGFYIETTMYPMPGTTQGGNCARFINPINNVGFSGANQYFNYAAFDPDVSDSIYVQLDDVQELAGTPVSIPYNAGFTALNPFGALTTNFDSKTGLLSVTGVQPGRYVASFLVKSYTNGVLTSTTDRDVPFFFGASSAINANINLFNIKGTANVTQTGQNYIVEMQEGDSIMFGVEGEHVYMVNGVVPDVTLAAGGTLFSSGVGTSGNCIGNNCADFVPANGNFTNQGISYGAFKFKPDTTFLNTHGKQNIVSFYAYAIDSCGILRGSSIGMQIIVKEAGNLYGPTNLNICYNDSVQANILGDTNGITWSPTTGVSNPNSASPILSPPGTTLYTVKNAAGDSTQVLVDVAYFGNFSLLNNGQYLTIPALHVNQTHEWFYNGAKLNVYSDSLKMDLTGFYWAEVSIGSCVIYSDTVKAIVSMKAANTNLNGSAIMTNATQASFTFSVNHYSNTLNFIQIINPSISFNKAGDNVDIKLMDPSGTVLWFGPATRQSFHIWETPGMVNIVLSPGVVYLIEIDSDINDWVLFKPDTFPYTDSDDVFTINSGDYTDVVSMTGAVPYLNFEMSSSVGIDEEAVFTEVYPNPANEVLNINLLNPGKLLLFDIQGKVVLEKDLEVKNKLDVSEIPAGLYIYEIETINGTAIGKVIIQ